ncbi:MAG: class I SAM-dependent methyltransferase, partial [Anaerolineae bacterium]
MRGRRNYPKTLGAGHRAPTGNFELDSKRNPYFAQLEKEEQELIDPATGRLRADLARYVVCPVCDTDNPELLFDKRGYTFVRCRGCTMVYVNPQVDDELLERLYTKSLANEMWVDVLASDAERHYNVPHHDWLLERMERLQRGRRLLDLGCSIGDFLVQVRNRGWDVTGMELGERATTYAREVHRLTVIQTTLEEARLPGAGFDAVTMLSVLEHLARPRETLLEVHRILRPGGVLGVIVPNAQSLAVLMLREETRTFTGRNHPNYFSLDTLTRLLLQAGFRVAAADTYVSSLQAILNAAQLRNPYLAEASTELLPKPVRELIEARREELEALICGLGMGYRIKLVAQKFDGSEQRKSLGRPRV